MASDVSRRRFLALTAGAGAAVGGPAMLAGGQQPTDELVTPPMTDEPPAPGRRVRQTAPGYEGTDVYHTVYLPTDWRNGAGGRHPVVVEYTGNYFPACGSTGEVKDANLAYGLTGGQRCIWLGMAYVGHDGRSNATTWWGDLAATVEYCKRAVPQACDEFHGDPGNVIICGFSRGAIAANYIGLADDDIAGMWKGFFCHDHYDGIREWPYPGSDRASALVRLRRLAGRPQLISHNGGTVATEAYLEPHAELGEFTFLDPAVSELFDLPHGKIIHPHTDLWMCKDSAARRAARRWLADVLARPVSPKGSDVDGAKAP